MTTGSRGRHRATRQRAATPAVRRPAMLSAAAVAAISVFLAPLPAMAAPTEPVGVPDSGSRPAPTGALQLPGTGAATITTPVTTIATTPLLAKVEKQREKVAALGDRLLELREQQTIARQAATTVDARHAAASAAVQAAKAEAAAAAAASLRESAAMPPAEYGSGWHGLGSLSRIQRGEASGRDAAARHLAIAEQAYRLVDTEKRTAAARNKALYEQYDKTDADYRRESAALATFERENADQLAIDEAAIEQREQNLGERYVSGGDLDGKGAHPSAIAAVTYALAQLGDMYLWAAEGPDRFDCSGLMLAAYRSAGYTKLPRVSRDQYWASRGNAVNPERLVPGDLLFFSSSNSWTDIHHVAMYIGNGQMVEAPRSGVPVRVTTVRWSRLFAATRLYGAVDEPVKPPTIPARPKPSASTTTKPPTSATPKPTGSSATPGPSGSSSPSPTTPSPATPSATTPSATTPSPTSPPTGPSPTSGPPPTSGGPSGDASTSGPASQSASSSASRSASSSASGSASRSASSSPSGSASGSASAGASTR